MLKDLRLLIVHLQMAGCPLQCLSLVSNIFKTNRLQIFSRIQTMLKSRGDVRLQMSQKFKFCGSSWKTSGDWPQWRKLVGELCFAEGCPTSGLFWEEEDDSPTSQWPGHASNKQSRLSTSVHMYVFRIGSAVVSHGFLEIVAWHSITINRELNIRDVFIWFTRQSWQDLCKVLGACHQSQISGNQAAAVFLGCAGTQFPLCAAKLWDSILLLQHVRVFLWFQPTILFMQRW